ncbi:GNAT family N-acetyltransferase [Anatilimnocola floriformis]|uniref:GNAT family N-acetyltransferase n=1 Tax=Anatilimnocola floriformis TaxID=2948575 RepID=UPI0020C2E317|nr:GNAT family N-acetyltransferase [Anatilimnocola floriformis]
MQIRVDDLTSPAVLQLLQEHLQSMHLHSPPESVHALDLAGLRSPAITVWTIWDGDESLAELLGCGALQELDPQQGEIKSMRTAAAHMRKGVARRLLEHIIATARQRGYRQLSLETGSAAAFEPARRLYADFGFTECGPFGDYVIDPHSVFMTLALK